MRAAYYEGKKGTGGWRYRKDAFLEQEIVKRDQVTAQHLTDNSIIKEFKPGDVIYKKGQRLGLLFFCFYGSVELVDGDREVDLREAGESFGSFPFVNPTRFPAYTVTAIAREQSVIAEVSYSALRRMPQKKRALLLLRIGEKHSGYLDETNRKIAATIKALRLAVKAPSLPHAPDMSLEKIVSGGGFADLRDWAEKMVTIGQRICRIEDANGTPRGTGLLVAEDRVLTNYHVVEDHICGTLDPASIRCRFDYARDAKGLDEGRTVTLAAGSAWIVAQSAYDAADLSGTGIPADDHLDFVLLRLSEAASSHEVGGGARRGVLTVQRQPLLPSEKAPIFIVQHPKGTPLALAIGIVLGVNESGTRLRYNADTLGGSSGSGVFNQRLELAALHHAGDPTSKIRAQYNQGIPIGAIVTMLEAKKIDPFWR